MSFVAIMLAAEDGRVGKYMDFATEAEAQAHVARFAGQYPQAFVAAMPNAPFPHWKVDMAAKTVTVDPPPVPPHSVSPQTIVDRIEAAGKMDELTAALDGNKKMMVRFLAMKAVASDNTAVRNAISNLALDPDVILAPEGSA